MQHFYIPEMGKGQSITSLAVQRMQAPKNNDSAKSHFTQKKSQNYGFGSENRGSTFVIVT